MSYTLILTSSQAGEIISKYHEFSAPHTNNYTLFKAKYKQSVITIFKTLTLIVQGSNTLEVYNEICDLLEIDKMDESIVNSSSSVNLSVVGTDEVGTGDFFGPIVVAGAFVPKNKILHLMKMGVKDSKLLNDSKIMQLAPQLMKDIKYSALVMDNVKYNFLTKVHGFNMNKIKALLHNNVIYNLLPKIEEYDAIIIDGFTNKEKYFEYLKGQEHIINDVQLEEQGETKYIAIATASIIARYLFLVNFEKLSQTVGFELPKGAGPKVDLAISKLLKEQSERYLDLVGKTNFKNMEKVKKRDNH
ncbi:MAG: ribonuclease HIII [Bacilli bacterium]|nr:ribonuclease HIII [Bacilli bacterium]